MSPPQRHYTIQRRPQTPVWVQIAMRVGLVLALMAFIVLIHWLERDGLKDNYDNHVSFTDVLYFTMISITTTGYGDIAPVTDEARLFDAFIVTPVRIFVILIFLGTTYSFVIRRTWEKWKMRRIQQTLFDHLIVCGFGVSGQKAVAEMAVRGHDLSRVVVIDTDADALAEADRLGCALMNADATRDEVLRDAGIERARAMIVSAGRDDTSILIVLTARHLAPALPISVVIRNGDNEQLAQQAGASTVINPVSFTGLLLAGSTAGSHIAAYLADLASADGRVALAEREAGPADIGKPLGQLPTGLAVRLYRDGAPFSPWDGEASVVQGGDRIIEIVQGRG